MDGMEDECECEKDCGADCCMLGEPKADCFAIEDDYVW